MSKGRREAPESASARLCKWRGLNWGSTRMARAELREMAFANGVG